MADNPYRVSWELDEENMVAVATLKQKDEDSGEFEVVETREFELADVRNSGLGDHIALYGLSKVLQDRASSSPSGPEKLDTMGEVFSELKQGNWKRERSGGGAGGAGIPPVVEAIAEMKSISLNEAARSWKATDKETKDRIKANDEVAAKIEEIKQRRSESGSVDLTDLG